MQAQQHAAKLATPPTILRMNTCCLHEGAEAVIAMECELLEMDFLVCSQFGISVPIEVRRRFLDLTCRVSCIRVFFPCHLHLNRSNELTRVLWTATESFFLRHRSN